MSFLPTLPSTTPLPKHVPATLSYFTIFSPLLRPPKGGGGDDDDRAVDRAQMLFCTSRERAVPQERMLRQIGIARGIIEFSAMLGVPQKPASAVGGRLELRAWCVRSTKRRIVLVEVQPHLWMHACIDLARTSHPNSSPTQAKWEYRESWLHDDWLQSSLRRAWAEWRLLNGPPGALLSGSGGLNALQRSLEKFFSVWAWSWDVEGAHGPGEGNSSQFADTIEGTRVTPQERIASIDAAVSSLTESSAEAEKLPEIVFLNDTLQLQLHDQLTPSTRSGRRPSVCSELRREIVRHVLVNLSGLERERELVRAAAAVGSGGKRRGGTSGDKELKPSKLGTSNMRSSARNTTAPRSPSRPSTPQMGLSTDGDTMRWMSWKGMWNSIGGRGSVSSSGTPASTRSSSPNRGPSTGRKATSLRELAVPQAHDAESPTEAGANKVEPSSSTSEAGAQPQDQLPPVNEGITDTLNPRKMWNSAGGALKSFGTSLGMAPSTDAPVTKTIPGEDHLAIARGLKTDQEASVDATIVTASSTSTTTRSDSPPASSQADLKPLLLADGDPAHHTDVQVDLTDLAEAMNDRSPLATPALSVEPARRPEVEPSTVLSASGGVPANTTSPTGHKKAFPSISITSAAWYRTPPQTATPQNEQEGAPKPSNGSIRSDNASREEGDGVSSSSAPEPDFDLDGWGDETPQPWATFRAYWGGSEWLVAPDGGEVHETTLQLYDIFYTTRRLLTAILIFESDTNEGFSPPDMPALLLPTWNILRRTQRLLNDARRAAEREEASDGADNASKNGMTFLHFDQDTLSLQDRIFDQSTGGNSSQVDAEVEGYLFEARHLTNRLPFVNEVFSRANNGRIWTIATRVRPTGPAQDDVTGEKGITIGAASVVAPTQTYLVVSGKQTSIADADNELRKLAHDHPAFHL